MAWPIGQQPSFLDVISSLWGGALNAPPQPQAGVPPMPAPNPARLPPIAPVNHADGGFLSTVFDFPWPGEKSGELRQRRAESDARQRYARDPKSAPPGTQVPSQDEKAEDDSELSPEEAAQLEESVGLPERSPFSEGTTRGPDGSIRVPVGAPRVIADPLKALMLQMGLSLMVPQWGNGLSQIGQAAGQGFAAAGRANQMNEAEARRVAADADKDADRDIKARSAEADINYKEALTEDVKSGESSRSRRLKGRQPTAVDEAANAAGLGPKGKAYFAQRLKTLNEEDLLSDEDAEPTAKYLKIIEEAKKLDAPVANTPAKAPNVGGTETVQGQNVEELPLVTTPEEALKLGKGKAFYFMRNGQKMLGRTPE